MNKKKGTFVLSQDSLRTALRELVEESDVLQKDVAKNLGMSEQKLSKVLNGANVLKTEMIPRILAEIDVEPSIWLTRAIKVTRETGE